jgi:CRISPR-associated protein Csx3
MQPMKVVLCGPPHSGKSCLREGLKQAIRQIPNAPYPYVLTACPDGEGAWYSETARNNLELASKLKQAYKRKFTWEFAHKVANDVKNVNLPLTMIDIGGIIDDKNKLIVAPATHAVILTGDMKRVPEWQEFCTELNLKIVAIIYSDYNGVEDYIESKKPVLKGSIHHLERGEDISTRPMVQALAWRLVEMSNV